LDKWKEGDALVGMPKVRVVKVSLKKKKKVKTEEARRQEEEKEVVQLGNWLYPVPTFCSLIAA
jgi:hypothetical protein